MTPTDPVDQQKSNTQRTILLATDSQKSALAEVVGDDINRLAYAVYGHQSAQQEVATRLGFNGELREAQTCWYLLGNGYRAYNPRLMRFHSPDNWGPFGRGGLNPYMYCVGDPVNRSDPTGHWSVLALLSSARNIGALGYFTSILGTGLNLSSLFIYGGRARLANGLGTLSGITGLAAGASAMFNYAPQATQLLSATSVISGAASTYLGARALRTDFRHLGWYEASFRRPSNSPPAYFETYPPRGAPGAAPSLPPAYPLNSSTMLPVTAGQRPPAYSRQDPALFSRPLPEYEAYLSSSIDPIDTATVGGDFSAIRHSARLQRQALDRLDGLSTSGMTIRQRR
ncbi:hypothetical protein PS862_05281 [Pseudomonas fluorescens]|uniref:RHS repeat-associated core domain-containing protein n=1 Tax=Pseudomonas fluorescens TaxID=294 RepID=A0A5E7PHW4_PSEFL|nr:RHS repeat-associated core domain-containing protein [Pseudomonas fluorescens]VVP48869.1 hypothetical protein PS862_05281 [Pseudomonas fluorescens]